jgi:hypothetical protein
LRDVKPIQHSVYVARGIRGFGDGYATIILPAYLGAIGYGPVQIGIVLTSSLLGTALFHTGDRLDRAASRFAHALAGRHGAHGVHGIRVSQLPAHRRNRAPFVVSTIALSRLSARTVPPFDSMSNGLFPEFATNA